MYTIEDEFNINGGKHVLAIFLNWELFSMNNKTVIEFGSGFRIIWRIMEISEGVTPSSISIILHNKTLSFIH